MRYLFITLDGGGNLYPELALAGRLAERGLDIRFLGSLPTAVLWHTTFGEFDALNVGLPALNAARAVAELEALARGQGVSR